MAKNPVCKYSKRLREMFSQINPHQLPCLYKSTFEKHAVDVLRSCENGYYYAKQEEESPSSAWVKSLQDSVMTAVTMGDAIERTRNMRNSPNRKAITMSDFYEKMRVDETDANNNWPTDEPESISPWKTCSRRHHLPSVDSGLFDQHSSQESGLHTHSSNTESNSKSNLQLQQTLSTSSAPNSITNTNVNNKDHCKTPQNPESAPSSTNKASSSSDTKNSVRGTQKRVVQGCVVSVPPIAYDFDHHRNSSHHTKKYREQYTNRNLQQVLLQCAKKHYAGKTGHKISKVGLKCKDVRDGAYMEPASQKEKNNSKSGSPESWTPCNSPTFFRTPSSCQISPFSTHKKRTPSPQCHTCRQNNQLPVSGLKCQQCDSSNHANKDNLQVMGSLQRQQVGQPTGNHQRKPGQLLKGKLTRSTHAIAPPRLESPLSKGKITERPKGNESPHNQKDQLLREKLARRRQSLGSNPDNPSSDTSQESPRGKVMVIVRLHDKESTPSKERDFPKGKHGRTTHQASAQGSDSPIMKVKVTQRSQQAADSPRTQRGQLVRGKCARTAHSAVDVESPQSRLSPDQDGGRTWIQVVGHPQLDKTQLAKEPASTRVHSIVATVGGPSERSTVICRSRPTIPSNNRGKIYASAVETPIHIVTSGIKARPLKEHMPGKVPGQSSPNRWAQDSPNKRTQQDGNSPSRRVPQQDNVSPSRRAPQDSGSPSRRGQRDCYSAGEKRSKMKLNQSPYSRQQHTIRNS